MILKRFMDAVCAHRHRYIKEHVHKSITKKAVAWAMCDPEYSLDCLIDYIHSKDELQNQQDIHA